MNRFILLVDDEPDVEVLLRQPSPRLPCIVVMVRSEGEDPRQRAAMQQIAEWLEKLGMSEYADRFAEKMVSCSQNSAGGSHAATRFHHASWRCGSEPIFSRL